MVLEIRPQDGPSYMFLCSSLVLFNMNEDVLQPCFMDMDSSLVTSIFFEKTVVTFFRKYVQVCVQNLSELCFQLSDYSLKNSAECTDLQLVPLNPASQQVKFICWFIPFTHLMVAVCH